MSYHCSINAIQIPNGGKSRGGFIPLFQPRVAPVPWHNEEEMYHHIGFYAGDWRCSTNQIGSVAGLPHLSGILIAKYGPHALLWRCDGSVIRIISANFEPDMELREQKISTVAKKAPKQPKVKQLSKLLAEYD